MRRFVCLVTLGLALLWLMPLCAQQPTLTDVLTGKVMPLEVSLSGLKEGWLSFTIDEQQDGGFSQFFLMMASEHGGPRSDTLATRYFTQGHTVTLAGETYLLAYQLVVESPKLDDMIRRRMMHEGGEGDEEEQALLPVTPLTPETPLRLSLLHLRTAGSLRGIAPFEFARELAENAVKIKDQQTRVDRQRSLRNLRRIATAIAMYVQDHDGKYPEMARMAQAVQEYGVQADMLVNPTTKAPYVFNQTVNGKTEGDIVDPTTFALVWEATPGADDKYAVGFADGHASLLEEAAWKEVIKSSDATIVDEAARERQQRRKVTNSLKQIIIAVQMYAQDHDETMPAAEGFWGAIGLQKQLTRHPVTGADPGYEYNPHLSGKALGEVENPEEMAVIYEPKPWPDGSRMVAFFDGHVATVSAKDWETVKKDSGIT